MRERKMLNFKKLEDRVVPGDDETAKRFNQMNIGDEICVEEKKGRNMKFHRKYWKLLEAVIENQTHYKTKENLHEAIKFKSGYYETIIPLNGEPIIKTKSISVGSMSAEKFESFYSVALDECVALVSEESVNEIIRFM